METIIIHKKLLSFLVLHALKAQHKYSWRDELLEDVLKATSTFSNSHLYVII